MDDGEWTVDGRRMCADGFAIGGDPSAPVAVGFVGRCRFCRGDAVLPGRCGVAAPVRAGFAGQTDGKFTEIWFEKQEEKMENGK